VSFNLTNRGKEVLEENQTVDEQLQNWMERLVLIGLSATGLIVILVTLLGSG
jgi:hypothetical protein